MLKLKTIYLAILLVSSTCTLLSQIQITGTVMDKSKRAPLEFAHVFFLNQQHIGAISNEAGQFSLAIPAHLMEDTLVVSQLGYQHHYLPIKSIRQHQAELFIELIPNAIVLEEAIVMSEEALKRIIRLAIKRIPKNYPQKRHRLKAFFRTYAILDSTYTGFQESFVTIEDPGYSKAAEIKMFVHQLRKGDEKREWILALAKIYKNELWGGYHWGNVARNLYFNFNAQNPKMLLERSHFRYLGESIVKSDTLIRIGYVIENSFVEGVEGVDPSLFIFNGEIVINKTDYAIVKHRSSAKDYNFFEEIQYRRIDDKYYPYFILGLWSVHNAKKNKTSGHARLAHFYQVETKKKDFQNLGPHQKVTKEQRLEDLDFDYDPAFWKNNTILLQVPAMTALEKDNSRKEALEKQFEEHAKLGKNH